MLTEKEVSLMTMTDATTPVSFESFVKLPRGAQLLVAYCLVNDLFDVQLLRNDQDMLALAQYGWMVLAKTSIHGVFECSFPESTLHDLEKVEGKILASISEQEMERYKARKGKEYPWLW